MIHKARTANRRIVEAWSTRDSPPFVAANASEDFPKHPDKYTDNNAHASQFLFLLSCDIGGPVSVESVMSCDVRGCHHKGCDASVCWLIVAGVSLFVNNQTVIGDKCVRWKLFAVKQFLTWVELTSSWGNLPSSLIQKWNNTFSTRTVLSYFFFFA